MNIVFPDRYDFDEESLAGFRELGVQMYDDLPHDESIVIERVRDAEIISGNVVDITRNIIDNAPNLKFIISSSVGYEWIDYKYAAAKGIKVLNCPTHNAEAVAEHAIALMLAVAHRIIEAGVSLKDGRWDQKSLIGTELGRKKLGLVGYGRVGKLIGQKAMGIGMQVQYVNSSSTAKELDGLMKESDVVCLSAALNESTKGMIDERRLKLLKKTAIFINVARGAIVDEAALIELLRRGRIRGAGLDVFQNEPPFGGTPPNSIVEIAKLPNVVATPHNAYNSEETSKRLANELLKNIKSCINNNPINVVSG